MQVTRCKLTGFYGYSIKIMNICQWITAFRLVQLKRVTLPVVSLIRVRRILCSGFYKSDNLPQCTYFTEFI